MKHRLLFQVKECNKLELQKSRIHAVKTKVHEESPNTGSFTFMREVCICCLTSLRTSHTALFHETQSSDIELTSHSQISKHHSNHFCVCAHIQNNNTTPTRYDTVSKHTRGRNNGALIFVFNLIGNPNKKITTDSTQRNDQSFSHLIADIDRSQ